MTTEFLLAASRDLALLVVGSLLTLFGAWLSNRATANREAAAAQERRQVDAEQRDRAAAEHVRGLVFDLYVEARRWNQAANDSPLRFDEVTFHSAEMGTELIGSRRVRSLLDQAFFVARNAGITRGWGTIDETAPRAQTTAQYDALQVLSAYIRGDSVEGEFAERIEARRRGVSQAIDQEYAAQEGP
ncbi:hypothetical protein PFZ49_14155 [Microbacterium lacticum]|uniref:hypothetical protein n=1 Tax=Microbacterium lacticum TaxID=33885 RepID=UPI003A8360E1